MMSEFPKYSQKLNFAKEEETTSEIMNIIVEIRNVRSKMNVHPSKKSKLIFVTKTAKQEIEKFIENLYEKQIINKLQKESIDSEKIYKIVTSKFFENIQTAKQVYKETPFYTYINTKEIYNTENEENILVQGIIDLYYITKDDEIALVDYKTDYVENEEELFDTIPPDNITSNEYIIASQGQQCCS